ncbi:hydroxyisourate hydrolase [Singulisphaera sp. Ch08]|uniref:5-hydroxyisourate hydrolase n=1 Tax=Singulisphaera sp. Ch08 TaxID=3120278 RepID=A0AAU7C9M7_9BACT
MSISRITTHILDTTCGRPAIGVSVRLEVQGPNGWLGIGSGVSNEDGRIMNLGPAELAAGNYRIEIDTGAYYQQIETESFFSSVCLSFTLKDPAQHYHVPLLLSPFAISTYRGS